MAVAALKLNQVAGRWRCKREVLHGLMAVAALKQLQVDDMSFAVQEFSTASWPWPH